VIASYTGGTNMKVFNFLKRNKGQKIKFIKENNLESWWDENFSDKERKIIISESSDLLNNLNPNKTAARKLYLLAGNVITRFHNNNPDLIIRLLKKAAELAKDPDELFEIYSQLIKLLVEQERKEEARNLIKEAQVEDKEANWEQLLSQIN
jgi:hypothetical protein